MNRAQRVFTPPLTTTNIYYYYLLCPILLRILIHIIQDCKITTLTDSIQPPMMESEDANERTQSPEEAEEVTESVPQELPLLNQPGKKLTPAFLQNKTWIWRVTSQEDPPRPESPRPTLTPVRKCLKATSQTSSTCWTVGTGRHEAPMEASETTPTTGPEASLVTAIRTGVNQLQRTTLPPAAPEGVPSTSGGHATAEGPVDSSMITSATAELAGIDFDIVKWLEQDSAEPSLRQHPDLDRYQNATGTRPRAAVTPRLSPSATTTSTTTTATATATATTYGHSEHQQQYAYLHQQNYYSALFSNYYPSHQFGHGLYMPGLYLNIANLQPLTPELRKLTRCSCPTVLKNFMSDYDKVRLSSIINLIELACHAESMTQSNTY